MAGTPSWPASFIAPVREASSADCFAGPVGSSQQCSLSEIDHSGIVRIKQDGLKAGDRVDLAVQMPLGTVPANARFEQAATAANAFSLTPLAGIGFGALALTSGSEPVDVLLRDGDRVTFASPDGVLPGQVGTVVDETVDVGDISGTVIDLAVRNYLWIAEVRGATAAVDWQLSRRNPADEHLVDFERAIFDALLPAGVASVLLFELRGRGSLDLRAARDAMYQDVVRKRWFAHRPDSGRNRLTWLGVGLLALGLVSTVALTFTVGYALLGVAVAIAGVALTLGAGTVLSGRADTVDLAATVLDLAVRNYLWVHGEPTEDGLPDWRLVRRHPPDEQLSQFERAVFALLLPGDAESIRLSDLRAARTGIGLVRGELYDDLVRRRWFSRPPDQRRKKLAGIGVRVCFYGLFLTVLLALTAGYAQLGVLIVVAGVALALGAGRSCAADCSDLATGYPARRPLTCGNSSVDCSSPARCLRARAQPGGPLGGYLR